MFGCTFIHSRNIHTRSNFGAATGISPVRDDSGTLNLGRAIGNRSDLEHLIRSKLDRDIRMAREENPGGIRTDCRNALHGDGVGQECDVRQRDRLRRAARFAQRIRP